MVYLYMVYYVFVYGILYICVWCMACCKSQILESNLKI